jgi:hypothetical protein
VILIAKTARQLLVHGIADIGVSRHWLSISLRGRYPLKSRRSSSKKFGNFDDG